MARPGPALFELIRGGGAPPPPRPEMPAEKPPSLVRITPKPIAVEPAPAPETKASAERAWAAWNKGGSWLDLTRSFNVPMSAILLTLGIMLALLVVTYATGWTLGKSRGEETTKRDLGSSIQPNAIPVNPNLIPGSPKAPDAKSPPVVERKEPPTTPTAAPAAAGGAPIAGLNYFVLASGLDKESAQRMAGFLTQNGLPAATSVDKPATGSNNPGSYIVFASRGLTSEEYKLGERFAARAEVVSQSARLGKIWQRDHKGQTDFSQAFWKKF